MKNILHVVTSLDNCGTEKYLINLLKGTYKQYNNYILVYNKKNMWEEELRKMNIKVICLNDNKNNKERMKFIRMAVKENNIDIVYAYTYYNSACVVLATLFTSVKKRIVHSHRTNVDRKVNPIKKLFCKLVVSLFSTNCLACSKEAGKSLFLPFRKIEIIDNCIDTSKYIYNSEERVNLKSKLNFDDNDIVIGTIGRLDYNKNQKFLINIVKIMKKTQDNIKLIIIGDGEEKKNLENMIEEAGLSNQIKLLGNKDDANRYYNVMDVFVLTSYNEGLPFVLIEAQTNGLSCIVSDCVSKDAKINDNFVFISIEENIETWINHINKYSKIRETEIDKIVKKYSLNSMHNKIINDIYER